MKKLVLILASVLAFAAMSCSSAKTSTDTGAASDKAAPAAKSPVDLGASSAGRGC